MLVWGHLQCTFEAYGLYLFHLWSLHSWVAANAGGESKKGSVRFTKSAVSLQLHLLTLPMMALLLSTNPRDIYGWTCTNASMRQTRIKVEIPPIFWRNLLIIFYLKEWGFREHEIECCQEIGGQDLQADLRQVEYSVGWETRLRWWPLGLLIPLGVFYGAKGDLFDSYWVWSNCRQSETIQELVTEIMR